METMDTSYQRELPKPLLMYFTYNTNTLGDAEKSLYVCQHYCEQGKRPTDL